jgi:sugar phosphate isomerase/epimerase
MPSSERSLSLYEIETELLDAAERAVDGDDTALSILAEYLEQGMEKRDRVAAALRVYDVQINAHAAEERRIAERKARLQRQKERLQERVIAIMRQLDYQKLEGKLNTFTLVANPPSVQILNAEEIPAQFTEIRQEVSIKKAEIAKVLKQGGAVPGADLKVNSVRLEIR